MILAHEAVDSHGKVDSCLIYMYTHADREVMYVWNSTTETNNNSIFGKYFHSKFSFMRRSIICALLLMLSYFTTLSGQAWEEIYYTDFGTVNTQTFPPNWERDSGNQIFHLNDYGATGAYTDRCVASLLGVHNSHLSYKMEGLSDAYEYYATLNLKTDDPAGAQLAFYHSSIAEAGGTLIGSPIDISTIVYTSPGQVMSTGFFSGLNGTHYFNIVKGPTDPSEGDERTRLDDFRLYRRPVGGINAPPSVNLTAPADGAIFTTIADISLTANASDSDGSIQSVKFYYGTTLISEDTNSPYEATITGGLPSGTYTLKAEATDDDGATSEAQITITVNPDTGGGNTISVCSSIDSSSDDAEERSFGNMSLSGNTLELVYGGLFSGNQTVGLRFNNLNIPQGTTISSAYIQFTVGDTDDLDSNTLTIRGQASDNPTTFTSNSSNISNRPLTNASVSWSPSNWTTIGEAGTLQKTVDIAPIIQELVNRPGFSGSSSIALVITGSGRRTAKSFDNSPTEAPELCITYQAVPPVVALITPTDGAVFEEGVNINLEATAIDSDGTIQSVKFYHGTTLISEDVAAPYTAAIGSGLPPGLYTLKAVATDNDGASSESEVAITIAAAPTPQIVSIPTTSLGKGDLIFIGFDNDIGSDKDRIIITNLVDLQPQTSFMITNANYCGVDDTWRSLDSLDGYIPIQEITYIADSILPAGSVICLDIPAQGDYMISEFMIDGNITTDFEVLNIGQRAIPDVNLRKDSTVGHLFLLQGGEWRFNRDYGTFTGRVVAPPIRYGADWDAVDCSTGSQLPGAEQCIAGPSFPTVGGSVYAYFDCSEYGSQYSPFAFMKEAIDPSKWDIYNGTDILDLSATACGMDCDLVQDSIYWVFLPDTLILDCLDNYQDSIDVWLANYGNAMAASSCQDSVDISVTFNGITAESCSVTGQDVFFAATDSCGGRITALGNIQVNISAPLSFTSIARDTTVQCDPDSFSIISQAWIDDHGGARVNSNCFVSWDYSIVESHSPCGLVDTLWATFYATSICGDTISTSAAFIAEDNIAPVFVSLPHDTTLNCANLGYLKHWLESAGESIVEDNCTAKSLLDITSDFDRIDGLCGSTLVTFMVSDGCGNATTATATLTIIDDLPPTIEAFPESYSVSIADSTFQATIHHWLEVTLPYDKDSEAEVSDLCTTDPANLVWDHDYNDQLVPGQCDSTLVNISIRDVCGNTVDTSLIVYAVDNYAPYFETTPDTLSLSCSLTEEIFDLQLSIWKSNRGGATIADEVGSGWTVTAIEEESVQQSCGYYSVLFIATDDCGNSGSITGIVEVTDDSPPYFTGGGIEPLYITYGDTAAYSILHSWLTENQDERADDNCQDSLAWSTSLIILPDSSCLDIPVVFSIDDGCHVTTDTSFVNIYIPQLDTLSTGDDHSTSACSSTTQNWLDTDAGINVTTGCGEVIDFDYEIIATGADCGSRDVVFTGFTPWGDTLSFTHVLSTVDDTVPSFISPPGDLTIYCSDINAEASVAAWLGNYGYAVAVDDCAQELEWYRNFSSIDLNCGTTTVVFTIQDYCGNINQSTAMLTIVDDQSPIVEEGTPLEIYLEAGDLSQTGNNSRISNLIDGWLQNNGGANAVDYSYCVGQTVLAGSPSESAVPIVGIYPYTESFEDGPGLWEEKVSAGIWQHHTGATPSSGTGPSAASDGSYYFYTESSDNEHQLAELHGPRFDLTGATSADFSFQYHMYGPAIGSIRLMASIDSGANWTSLFYENDNLGDQWNTTSVSLNDYLGQEVQLKFRVFIGSAYTGDVAIDDLELTTERDESQGPGNSQGLQWINNYSGGDYAPTACDSIPVIFSVEDECGNISVVQSSILIRDTINYPIVDTLPQALIIPCDTVAFTSITDAWLTNFGYGDITDQNGEPINWSHDRTQPIEAICSTESITFTATNSCGNSVNFVVDLIIEDHQTPVIDPVAGQIFIDSGWDSLTRITLIDSWLSDHGGADAIDNCQANLDWSHDMDNAVYSQTCGTTTVTFTASDGCSNEAVTTGNLIFYQQGFIIDQAGGPIDLICCAIDMAALDNWLDNQANAHITTTCGEELTWSYSGYDPNATNACIDQVITFTGSTPYGATYTFNQSIQFYASACCEGIDVSLSQTGNSGTEVVEAVTTNCPSPLYTWYINGKPIPDYTTVTSSSIPYSLYGPGIYSVSVDCEGYICDVENTLELCQDFTLTLECFDNIVFHTSDHNCQQELERFWYRDGEFLAYNSDFVPIDDFGTYTLQANCDDACYAEESITISCNDVGLEIVDNETYLEVEILGCHPENPTITWLVDGVAVPSLDNQWVINDPTGGLYEAQVVFPGGTCTVSATLDYCPEFSMTITEVEGELIAVIQPTKIVCFTDAVPEWRLEGTTPLDLGLGFSVLPAVDGTYYALLECDNGCSASATYEWESPCTQMQVELTYIENNFTRIDAIVTGASRCEGLLYSWYKDDDPSPVELESPLSYHYPDESGDYHVVVRCISGSCTVASNDISYQEQTCGNYTVEIQRTGNDLCAVINGTTCGNHPIEYVWEKTGGTLVGPFTDCITIPNPSEATTYRVTAKCDHYCESYDSYETIPCDLSVSINQNNGTLCASVLGSSCTGHTPVYIWRRNGQLVQGVTGDCYVPLTSGRYEVEVICGTSPSCTAISSELNYTYYDHCDIDAVITEDSNGQLCATIIGTSCDGQSISYNWTKSEVGYSTSACFTPSVSGFYKLYASCTDDQGEICEVVKYYSYQIACDLSVDITRNHDELCATIAGNSCDNQSKSYDWYLDGSLLSDHSNCIPITTAGTYSVEVSCGDCEATKDYSISNCDLPALSLVLVEGYTCTISSEPNCVALEVESLGICTTGPSLTLNPSDNGYGVGEWLDISQGGYFIVTPLGCYSLSQSNDCGLAAGCPDVTTTFCFSGDGTSSYTPFDLPMQQSSHSFTSFDQLNIFPNPTQNEFNISMHLNTKTALQLSMYDANGKIVLQDEVNLLQGQNQLNYTTHNLPEGVYIIRLQTKEELVHRKLMVIK